MGMTITEKILAIHAGRESVSPEEIVDAQIDYHGERCDRASCV